MEMKNEYLDMELQSLEKALCNGYSIKGECKKGDIREVTIHPRLHEHKPPFVRATSSRSIGEALWNAAENYERWRVGQEQIDLAKDDVRTVETDQQIKTILVFLDVILFTGPVMEITKTKDAIKCTIKYIHIGKLTGIREGKGKTIFESICKATNKPIRII